MAFLGDVMCGDSFYALGSGVASSMEKYGGSFLPSAIVDYLHRHDLVFCNLECVLSNIGRKDWSLRRLQMRGRPEFSGHLAQWGITVANVANNHILEHGRAAACDTITVLEAHGIQPVGAGKALDFQRGLQVHEAKINGQSVAIVGLSLLKEKYVYDGGGALDEALSAVEQYARQDSLVLVSLHWGQELMHRPSIEQKSIAARLAQAGTKLIIGHHPHVVQGVEELNGCLVAYSLGNFIFDCILSDCRWSVILSVELSSHNEITNWDVLPVELDAEHRPVLPSTARSHALRNEFERRCQLTNDQADDCAYQQEFRLREEKARRKLHRHVIGSLRDFRPVFWPQVFLRPIQRRLGLW